MKPITLVERPASLPLGGDSATPGTGGDAQATAKPPSLLPDNFEQLARRFPYKCVLGGNEPRWFKSRGGQKVIPESVVFAEAEEHFGIDTSSRALQLRLRTLLIEKPKALPASEDNEGESRIAWLEEKLTAEVEFDYMGRCFLNSKEYTMKKLIDLLVVENANRGGRLSTTEIGALVRVLADQTKQEHFEATRAALVFQPELAGAAHKVSVEFVRLLMRHKQEDETAEEYELAVQVAAGVVRHMVWQVKRKMHDLSVGQILMLVVTGRRHGSGKSSGLSLLLAPLNDLADLSARVEMLTDERNWFRLSDTYAFIFDEMTNASKQDVAALKQVLTARQLQPRLLGHNSKEVIINRTTCFGTANKGFVELVRDETGARRFFELEAHSVVDLRIWEKMQALDFETLWRGIDETHDVGPAAEFKEQLDEAQKLLVIQMPLQEWVAATSPSSSSKFDDLYLNYRDWAEEARLDKYLTSRNYFGRELRALGYSRRTKNGVVIEFPQPAEPTADRLAKVRS